MADSNAFEWLCEGLEHATSLDRLEARGTVRIALKQSGLDARHVTGAQMAVVLRQVMPNELEGRGISDAMDVCEQLAGRVGEVAEQAADADTPEAVFARLG